MTSLFQAVFLVLLGLTAAFAAESTAAAGPTLAPGIEYRLTRLNDQELAIGSAPTLILDAEDQRVSGFNGVNRYSGGYTLVGDVLTIGQALSTMMAGEEAAMKIEQDFMGIISQPLTISVISGELALTNAKGSFRLIRQVK
jgi:heat shock protein HslJ